MIVDLHSVRVIVECHGQFIGTVSEPAVASGVLRKFCRGDNTGKHLVDTHDDVTARMAGTNESGILG